MGRVMMMKHGQDTSDATKHTSITVRLPANMVAALDRFIAQQDGDTSRAETVAGIVRAWAIDNGFAHRDEDGEEGLRPEELNAANDD